MWGQLWAGSEHRNKSAENDQNKIAENALPGKCGGYIISAISFRRSDIDPAAGSL